MKLKKGNMGVSNKGVLGIMVVFMIALFGFVVYYFFLKNAILDVTNSIVLKFLKKVNQTLPEDVSQVNPSYAQEIYERQELTLTLLFFVPIVLMLIWAIIEIYIVRVIE